MHDDLVTGTQTPLKGKSLELISAVFEHSMLCVCFAVNGPYSPYISCARNIDCSNAAKFNCIFLSMHSSWLNLTVLSGLDCDLHYYICLLDLFLVHILIPVTGPHPHNDHTH